MRDSALFDEAVTQYFEPIARKLELSLFKVEDGIYEIPSPYFILRIRLDTGHHRGLNVILRKTSICVFEDYKSGMQFKPGNQLGIGCFMQDEILKQIMIEVNTDEDFLKRTQLLAQAAEHYCVPYLLGRKNDFEAIGEMIRKKGEPERKKLQETMRNIKRNFKVVEGWPVFVPREKGEEREAAKEFQGKNIHFLGEQEGSKEQILKEKLAEFFNRDKSVEAAYLVRFIGNGIPANAALCLRTQFGSDRGMVEKIAIIFANVFDLQENLNIIFLTDKQESSLAKVCRPFFEKK